MAMPDLAPVYERLESLLSKHTSGLKVSHDFADANAATTATARERARPSLPREPKWSCWGLRASGTRTGSALPG